jgi:hypothetical protein
MVRESEILLECSNELYRLARRTKDIRWKRELTNRARAIGEMRDPYQVVIVLQNLVVEADARLRMAA